MMNYTRLYTGDDGESHFEDIEVVQETPQGAGLRSEGMQAEEIFFLTVNKSEYHWQNAPRRQFVLPIDGMFQVEVGDGSKRQFGLGDILLAEDTTGHGHVTTVFEGQSWSAVFIPCR